MEQDVIQKSNIFQGLNDRQLQRIAAVSHEETYGAGHPIFRQGDPADNFYVLHGGKVLLELSFGRMQEYLNSPLAIVEIVSEGQTFGWSALVKPHLYTLSASTAEKSKAIVIEGTKLRNLMDDDPTIGYQVMKGLSEVIASRLRDTREMLLGERGFALLSQTCPY